MAALENETGAVFEVADPKVLSRELSAHFEGVDLTTAIRVLLDGYSYASGPTAGGTIKTVRILATGQQSRKAGRYPWPEAPRREDVGGEEDNSAEESGEGLASALDSLRSAETDAGRREAIERIVDTKSAGATRILIEQALGEGSEELRAGAVDALWRHAADGHFSDPAVIETLQRLTTDEDAAVRAIAVKSLADMERYLESSSQPLVSTP